MPKQNTFTALLQKPMTRKQFLAHLGLSFFVVSGVSSLLGTLSDPSLTEKKVTKKKQGFGGGTYGTT